MIDFHEALENTIQVLEDSRTQFRGDLVILRNMHGLIRIFLENKLSDEQVQNLTVALEPKLGPYKREMLLAFKEDLFDWEQFFHAPAKKLLREWTDTHTPAKLYLLERQEIGEDWDLPPLIIAGDTKNVGGFTPPVQRVNFFGIKGGVGRSTALILLARYWAKAGKKVLVLDLDLESPGVGHSLLYAGLPDYGLVDWFVEDAVGQGEDVFSQMWGVCPINFENSGQIRVVPAWGAKTGDYIPKLARTYGAHPDAHGNLQTFATRLGRVLQNLEKDFQPDLVLLDSRAGIHDISAVTITRLNALSLLFAINSAQTWQSYGLLFQYWRSNLSHLSSFRENLKMVAGQLPETNKEAYLETFRDSSYNLFCQIYEEDGDTTDDAFNFSVTDALAPHQPLKIEWNRSFFGEEFSTANLQAIDAQIEASYGSFFHNVNQVVFGDWT